MKKSGFTIITMLVIIASFAPLCFYAPSTMALLIPTTLIIFLVMFLSSIGKNKRRYKNNIKQNKNDENLTNKELDAYECENLKSKDEKCFVCDYSSDKDIICGYCGAKVDKKERKCTFCGRKVPKK